MYQTAKIAKLLLMMEKGEGGDYKGKTLEEIDVQLEFLNQEKHTDIYSDNGKHIRNFIFYEISGQWNFLQTTIPKNADTD